MRACSRSAATSASKRPFWYWSRYNSAATSNANGRAFTSRMRRSSGDTHRARNRRGCETTGGASAERVLPSGIRPLSMLLVAIADAVERLDVIERVIHGAELLADALDVTIDRPVIDVDVLAVRRVDELVAALYHARSRRERLYQKKFGDRELDILGMPGALVLGLVQGGFAAHPPPAGRGAGAFSPARLVAAQQCPDTLDQQALGERLGDVIVRAETQAHQLVDLLVLGGEEDDRHRAALTQLL